MMEPMAGRRLDTAFLDGLAAELAPARPLRLRGPLLALGLALLGGWTAVGLGLGVRADVMAGAPTAMFVARTAGLLLLAGLCVVATLELARPGVGQTGVGRTARAWQGALAMAGLAPGTALLMALAAPDAALAVARQPSGLQCLGVGLAAGFSFALIMLGHLRRGAPVTPERAGTLLGMASGSLGVLAYSLHCPFDSVLYVGLWYSLTIAVATALGRLLVPGLIRW